MTQKALYLHNRERLHDIVAFAPEYRRYEQAWIDAVVSQPEARVPVTSLEALLGAIDGQIAAEASAETPEVRYVRASISLPEFRTLVQEFALDGLTEAQSFYYVMPRLPLSAQLPMLRILIDEFGSGNPQRMHTQLYVKLLQELRMPTSAAAYLDRIEGTSFAFVNQFYWLTVRADDPSYFAGAITYLESVIPYFFPCYVEACARLAIQAHHYYSEHCHIDHFHALEGRRLLNAMAREKVLDPQKAWQGAYLASSVTNDAFVQAVHKAQRQPLEAELQHELDASGV